MNKLLTRSIVLTAFLLIPFQVWGQGYLHTSGKTIVNGRGEEVHLKGIGLGGWMLQEPYMMKLSGIAVNEQEIRAKIDSLIGEQKTQQFYDEWLKDGMQKSDVDSLAKWGFNSIRLPMNYRLFTLPVSKEPVRGGNTWLQKGFNLTDSLLKWCADDHIYLILDLHAAPGGQGHELSISNRDPERPSLWQSWADRQKTVALWKKLARRYKSKKWIGGYDLLNEPNWSFVHPRDKNNHGCRDSVNAPLRKLYIRITHAIRSVDQHHIIFLEGNCYATNFRGLLPPWADNTVISFHKYWDKNNTASIQKYLNIRKEYHIPLWLGESGENTNQWYRSAISLMNDNNIGWSWWPLKKIGANNPFQVKMPPGFRKIIEYWKEKEVRPTRRAALQVSRKDKNPQWSVPKPSSKAAFHSLMKLARNYKTQKVIVRHDVLDALFGFPEGFSFNRKSFASLMAPSEARSGAK